jgi:hypothetical protein
VMHLHAKNDPTVSYYGTPPYVLSVDELLASWRQINDCSEDGVELFNESGIIGTLWASPGTGNDVILYAYEEGGHAWLPYSTDLICEFFYNHPKRSNNIRIAAPVMGTIYAISAPVEITIDTEQAGNINRVEFYANDIQIGEDNEAPFSLTWTNEEIGEYSLKLIAYTDNGETIISSNSVTIWKCLPSIALNKICISSSDENSSLTPEYATDNDFLTRWSSEWSDPQWIYVDLGDIYTVNGVTLVWEPAYGTHYQIQTSTSATDWTEVYSTTNGQGKTEYIPFSATDAQYVRMYGTQRATRWGYSLWEFQVHTE